MKSVMIIEDEFIVAEDLKAAVEEAGYSIFGIAYTYTQAIEMLKGGKPDMALVDITLDQDRSGILLGLLFNGPLRTPYGYVTAHGDGATKRRADATFPQAYIMKPFKREQIHEALYILGGKAPAPKAQQQATPEKKDKPSALGSLKMMVAGFF